MSDAEGSMRPSPKALPFHNEPLADFSRKELRAAMQLALDDVASQFGIEAPLIIDGKAIDTRKQLASHNPSKKSQVVGTASCATPEQAEKAIEAARRAARSWGRVPHERRVEHMELLAAEMRNRRFELAAWIVYECGKPWSEADGDVCEAIDFCMFYAMQMRELSIPVHCDLPGEENRFSYRPRGVAVVIAPWNFPLAILTGMVAAALVAGNTVVMKPAEQSSIIASKLMEIAREAGIPDGVLNFLPGIGEEIGPTLVESPDVDIVVFTGSRPVGLAINKAAAETSPLQTSVKRVIAEMGGKNAIIVDEDANLDEAVQGVIGSAFGFSGQKCSACSRVFVLAPCYDPFLERLASATASLKIGPALDPATSLGPVIDLAAKQRIEDYIALGKEESRLVYGGDVGPLEKEGFFVAPHIFADVDPQSRLSQNEIFGPVVAVIKVSSIDQAFEWANATEYALTAGLYSRSPRTIDRARKELEAGNIYINRPITGAMVNRHPFGGYKMSGIGSKAGGRDYLLQFLIPVTVTENTLRRGFAPPSEDETET
ncbi:MAG: L-glutamate gamma-semialdehyde dehydrogenase [Planctomycetaceae bacterium]